MDYLKAHQEKKEELKDLNERRDKDYQLVTSYAYKMTWPGKTTEVSNAINVTMNRLKVFAAYVKASLAKAEERSFIESEDTKVKKDEIKDFVDAAFQTANYKLFTQGETAIEPYMDEQACLRGEIAALVVCEMMPAKDGKEEYLDINIPHLDTRSLTYERGSDGLAWMGYETTKTKGMIESESWFEKSNITQAGKEALVLDMWTPEENIIYIDQKEVFKQPNPFLYVPGCVQKVPIGTQVAAKDSLKYGCESIFFLVRDLIEEYYRCVSVLQTLNFLAIEAATQEYAPQSNEAQPVAELRPGSNVPVEAPNAISLIPYGKAERSMILALQEINKAINDGTLARITMGDLPADITAVALVQVEQGQGQVYMPRLGARGLLKEQIAPMIISQCQALGQSTIELGVPGHKRIWRLSDLEGEYRIGYKYANKSPETDFARVSMAKSYVDIIDELSILTDVLKRDDPEGDLRKLNRQRLRVLVPNLRIYDGLLALAEAHEEGDESAAAEIAIAEAQLGISAEQMLAGNLPQAGQKQPTQPVGIPLLANKSSAQGAADLIRTPAEEEGE